ncbi:MAG: glycosyltransferase 87 family protein [Thermomicrobiales bacterium]
MAQATEAQALPERHPDPPAPTATPPADAGTRRDFWLILLLAVAFRLPILFVTDGFDYWFYRSLGELSNLGFYPYLDYWVEYPPVFPWIAVGAYRLTLLFPPTLFREFDASFHLVLGSVLVLADLVVVALVGALSLRLAPPGEGLRRMILYAALFWPVVVAIGWYDTLPCAILLLGLWFLLRNQGLEAGAMTGLGFMTKVFPAILGPVGLKFLPQRREKVALFIGAAAVTLLIATPFLALSPTYFIASYRAVFARSSWETVWALIDGYFSWGKVAPLGVRFDPTTAQYIAYRSRVPTIPIAVGFAILYAILWFRPVARTQRNMALFTAISTLGFLLYSKGYSPQFIIYVLPFVVVLLPWRRALGYSLALSAVNLLEWPLYHEWFGNVAWLLIFAVVARTLLWIALIGEWLAELWGWENRIAAIRINPRVALSAAVAALLIAVPATVVAWNTWTNAYYNQSPLRPAFDFVRRYEPSTTDQAALVFADQDLYLQFHPYFWNNSDFYLFRPATVGGETIKHPSLTPDGRKAELADITSDHQRVIFVRNADDWTSRDLNDWLNSNMRLVASTRVGNADLSVWQIRDPTRLPRP